VTEVAGGAATYSGAASSRFCRVLELIWSLTNVLLRDLEKSRCSIEVEEDDEML